MYCILTGKTESDKDKEVSDIKERLRKTGPRRKVDYVILCCPPKDGKEPTSWPVKCKDPERGFIQNKECVFARYSHPVSQTANDWIRIKQRLTILNIKEKNSIQEKLRFASALTDLFWMLSPIRAEGGTVMFSYASDIQSQCNLLQPEVLKSLNRKIQPTGMLLFRQYPKSFGRRIPMSRMPLSALR